MSEVKVNKITPTADCGTVTLGDSGDTVAIASGATLTSAGSITNSGTITNTGTISGGTISGTIDGQVNWQTTVKTTAFTATAGEGYFCNTTSAAFTVTLPASPSAGDIVGIKDYANTADTNNITIGRNGSNIQGTANDFTISTEGLSIVLLYVDSTKGWLSVGQAKASDISEQALYTTATGGTVTTCGNFKIHTFTGPGTFCVSQVGNPAGGGSSLEYLVVAGGGGGAGQNNSARGGGGGGAGGYRTSAFGPSPLQGTALTATVSPYPVTVGSGGAGGPSGGCGSQGANSIFSTITSTGGGAGRGRVLTPGQPGGSGGGAGDGGGATPFPGGSGNTPPVSPPQGNDGGTNNANPNNNGGGGAGGGGAGAAGSPESSPGGYPAPGSAGGAGVPNDITGSAVTYAEGAAGGPTGNSPTASGPDNSGDGGVGGGGGYPGHPSKSGGSGGSGIVVIRYKYQN